MDGKRREELAYAGSPAQTGNDKYELDVPEPVLPDKPTEDIYIRLLGGFHVSIGSRTVQEPEWYLRKAKSLIKLLALTRGHELHREQIMDYLWPEMRPAAAANNLHKVLHIVRHALQPDLAPKDSSAYLHLRRDFVCLDPSGLLVTDVERFEAAAERAQRTRDPRLYEQALQLYTGDLLPEDRYEDWAAGRREQLRSLQSELLLALAGLKEANGDLAGAIDVLRQVVSGDPAHEEAHVALMHLFARSGQRHMALRQYRLLCTALQRELGVEPEHSTQMLYAEISDGASMPSRQLRSSSRVPHVPTMRSMTRVPWLVGRDGEIAALEQILVQLQSGTGGFYFLRGEAGLGKSALACELARRARVEGITTLWGTAYAHDRDRPYALVTVAMEEFIGHETPEALRLLLGDAAHELSGLIPALPSRLGLEYEESECVTSDTIGLFVAIETFLKSLAERAPLLIVLDDVHYAGEDSMQLLYYLARQLKGLPVALLGTLCPEEVVEGTQLHRLCHKLQHESLLTYLDLMPLTSEETMALVDHLLQAPADSAVHETVVALSAGSPFYVNEAIEALRGRGQIRALEGVWRMSTSASRACNTVRLRRPRTDSDGFVDESQLTAS